MIAWEFTARGARRWPKAADDMLRDLWARGDTGTEIADAMGITKNSVVGRAHRLGLPARPSPVGLGSRPRNSARRQGGDLAPRAAAGVSFLPAPAATPSLGHALPPRPRAAVASAFCPSSTANSPVVAACLTNPQAPRAFSGAGGKDGKKPLPQVFPARGCQFPMWRDGARVGLEDLRFCDAAPRRNSEGRQDSPYCEAHHARCFRQVQEAA
jgi:GcrA cell cycle regulator